MLDVILPVPEECFFICQDYLENFWQQLHAARELYSSISQALQEKESECMEREYTEHLPTEVLEAGIKSGQYTEVQHISTFFVCV